MIQRIQSVYLFFAALCAAAAAFLPLAFFTISTGEVMDLYAGGLRSSSGEILTGSVYMYILAILTMVLPLVIMFLFKKRMLQLRICVVETVLLFGYYAMIGVYYYLSCRAFSEVGVTTHGFHPALFAPVVSIVFCLLAAKAIFQDELLVRTADRIR